MIKLIASDMDGTLLNAKQKISDKNIAAIKKAQAQGVEFLIATGRAPIESRRIVFGAGLKPGFINLNGAMVFDENGKLMVENPLTIDKALAAVKILEESKCYFEIITAHHVYSNSRLHRISNFARWFSRLNQNISYKQALALAAGSDEVLKVNFVRNYKKIITEKDLKVMKFIVFSDEGSKVLSPIADKIEQLGDLIVTSSGSNNIEINSINAQKGPALMEYAALKGYKPEEVVAIGDNLNDESMIRMAGHGVAMANAVDQIKELASFITKSNNDDGVAYAIEHFLSEK